MVVKARYENGVFKPLKKIKLKQGTVLEIDVPGNGKKRRSIKDLAFVGMWKNRRDIKDGVSYVNSLRDNPRS